MGLRDRIRGKVGALVGRLTGESGARPETTARSETPVRPETPARSEAAVRPETQAPLEARPVVTEKPVTTPIIPIEAPTVPDKAPPAQVTPPTSPSLVQTAEVTESAAEGSLKSGNDAPTRAAHLRPSFGSSANAHTVRVKNPETGQELVFSCEPGEFVVEAAERAGFELPSSCRNGGCLTCTGKLLSGTCTIDEEQYVLEDEHIEKGFRLLCIASVHSDAEFLSHQQEEIQ